MLTLAPPCSVSYVQFTYVVYSKPILFNYSTLSNRPTFFFGAICVQQVTVTLPYRTAGLDPSIWNLPTSHGRDSSSCSLIPSVYSS
ncbi:hypothetical protein CDV36_004220 [Fusarium kuroshium]|uniref:Uncharacterized protein n=1 Tax=Fusarium kuroshium TaxID=2010991 RepID=A0A3M2SEV7_9HYPO|nr:hypothetical protein CDV36_004220 [Fusarium kuroshium]